MKYIFLDIDGVMIKFGEDPKIEENKKLGMYFDRDCVENLEWILKETGAFIVISSSWRGHMLRVKESFLHAGLDWNKVVSKTRRIGGRGEEILEWLKDVNYSNWVVIDDDFFDLQEIKQLGKLVQTKTSEGLTIEKSQEVINILNNI